MRLTSIIQDRASNDMKWTVCTVGCTTFLIVMAISLKAAAQIPGTESERADSLWRVVASTSGKDKLNAMLELIYETGDSDNEKALLLAKDAREFAIAQGDSLYLAMTTRIEGQLLRRIGKNNEGIVRLREAVGIAERNAINDEQLMASNALAIAYVYAGRYDSALRLYFSALRIPIEKNQERWRAVVLNGIGLLYYKLGEEDEAIKFSTRAIEAAEPINELGIVMTATTNIALCNIILGKYDLAEKLLDDWDRRFATTAGKTHLLQWEFDQGLRLLNIARYREARNYFERSLQHAKEVGDGFYELDSNIGIARCHVGLGNHREANRLLEWCEEKAIASGFDTSLLNVYEALLATPRTTQSPELILSIQAKYIKVKERVLNENVLHRISVALVEFEEEENQKVIARQAETIQLDREVIDRQRLLNVVSVTLAIVLVGFVILLYRFIRYQRSIAKDLDKRVVERTQELQSSQDILARSLGEQRMLMDLVSRKVRASMATLRGLWQVREMEVLDQHLAGEGFEAAAKDLLQISKIIDRSNDLRSEEDNDLVVEHSTRNNGKE